MKPVQYCADCQCKLDIFTGNHLMTKGKASKLCCGLCMVQAEQNGWHEIVRTQRPKRVKPVGRN